MPPRASFHGAARTAIVLQAVCFSIGALNHARDFAIAGWRPYRWAPLPAFELYWSALILLDLAVVLLLATGRIRTGLFLGLAVMASDVTVNVFATRLMGFTEYGGALLLQSAFLGFLLGSIGFLWSGPGRSAGCD
jgi:hypothetical protein